MLSRSGRGIRIERYSAISYNLCLVPDFNGAIFSDKWKEALWQVLHSSATTTQAVRRAIQNSQESLRTLAKRYGINQKTVAKWKKRTSVDDLTTGPKNPRSSVLSPQDEAAIVAFRKRTLLPLDDCLYALQPSIPYLTRSSLHRCLQRLAFHDCLRYKVIALSGSASRATPLVTFISTSLRCKQHRALSLRCH